ncbi:MAG: hypothetical protein MJ078_07530 [Clostridia bacterium]|nr:hypothetical protein [Clostridia bacterium]
MVANVITVSRIFFSLSLFLLSPSTVSFGVLYVLCGATDVPLTVPLFDESIMAWVVCAVATVAAIEESVMPKEKMSILFSKTAVKNPKRKRDDIIIR